MVSTSPHRINGCFENVRVQLFSYVANWIALSIKVHMLYPTVSKLFEYVMAPVEV